MRSQTSPEVLRRPCPGRLAFQRQRHDIEEYWRRFRRFCRDAEVFLERFRNDAAIVPTFENEPLV